jgi:hypothetical protein
MCKYSDDTGYKCPHENLEDNDYCIFHLQDDNKDVDEFNKGIKEILETEEDSINFHGFYFPPNTANFINVNFKKKVAFSNVTFSGIADFSDAKFSGDTVFMSATFKDNAYFQNIIFLDKLIFSNVTFSSKANFMYTKFSGDASFRNTTFSGNANFSFAKFSGEANFNNTTFLGIVDFMGTKFSELFIFIPTESEIIDLNHTYFSDNVRIKADLSKCYFANSNIERVDMTDSIWIVDNKPKNSFSAFYERIRNKMGISETSIIIWEGYQGKLKSNWKELEGIYRRLKQSYQKYGDTSTAGKFYYQEMECKRKQLKGIERYFQYFIYKKLCGYGEKPENVILASLFLIILFAYSYLFSGIEFVGSSILNVPANVILYKLSLNSTGIQWLMSNFDSVKEDFLLCLYTSVITFTTLGYGDVRPIGLSRIFASLEAGFGIIMTALFIFVFTRRMLR